MDPFPCSDFRLVNSIMVFPPTQGWAWRTRLENHFNLWVVLDGTAEMQVNETTYTLRPGMAFLLGPGDRVDARHTSGQPVSNLAIHFHPLVAGKPDMESRKLRFCGVAVRELTLLRELAAYGAAIGRKSDRALFDEAEMHTVASALLMMAWRNRQRPALDAIGERIQQQIDRIARDPVLTDNIGVLAQACGLSAAQYARRFVQLTGRTPAKFIIDARLQVATQLLDNTQLSIEALADALGYRDVFYFSRQFKQRLGVSPLAYRRREVAATRASRRG